MKNENINIGCCFEYQRKTVFVEHSRIIHISKFKTLRYSYPPSIIITENINTGLQRLIVSSEYTIIVHKSSGLKIDIVNSFAFKILFSFCNYVNDQACTSSSGSTTLKGFCINDNEFEMSWSLLLP